MLSLSRPLRRSLASGLPARATRPVIGGMRFKSSEVRDMMTGEIITTPGLDVGVGCSH